MNIEQKGWLGRLQQRIAAERWGYSFPEIPIERAMTEPLFHSPLEVMPKDTGINYRVYQLQGEGEFTTRRVLTQGRPIRRDGVNILTMSAEVEERKGEKGGQQASAPKKPPILDAARRPALIVEEESFYQDYLIWFRSHPNNKALPGLIGAVILLGTSLILLVDVVSKQPKP